MSFYLIFLNIVHSVLTVLTFYSTRTVSCQLAFTQYMCIGEHYSFIVSYFRSDSQYYSILLLHYESNILMNTLIWMVTLLLTVNMSLIKTVRGYKKDEYKNA